MTIQGDPHIESEIRDPSSRESYGSNSSAYIRYIYEPIPRDLRRAMLHATEH